MNEVNTRNAKIKQQKTSFLNPLLYPRVMYNTAYCDPSLGIGKSDDNKCIH
jgi:hypothetical protein